MYARNVSLRLKPNMYNEFKEVLDTEVIPLLRKQPGFRDEITFAMTGGIDILAISLWDSREQAEVYRTVGYPEVMKSLEHVLDAMPKLRVSDIVNSTFHDVAVSAA